MQKHKESLNQIQARINQRIPAKAMSTERFKRMAGHLTTMERALNGLETAKADVHATPEAKRDRVREAASAAFDAVSKSRRDIAETSKKVEKSFSLELREKSGWKASPFAKELRGAFSKLDAGEKVSTIQGWIKDADVGALQAVLDAPGLLTGLSSEDRAKYRAQFFQAAAPDIMRTKRVYQDLVEHVMAGVKTIEDAASTASDSVGA